MPPRVLIVEDEADLAWVEQFNLETEGYEVLVAPEGRSAIEALSSFDPDVLVLDKAGNMVGGPIGKPGSSNGSFQVNGPAIGLAYQPGEDGRGKLFASDSNQGTDGGAPAGSASNNSSRLVTSSRLLRTGASCTLCDHQPLSGSQMPGPVAHANRNEPEERGGPGEHVHVRLAPSSGSAVLGGARRVLSLSAAPWLRIR
jgi:hypothetical protein